MFKRFSLMVLAIILTTPMGYAGQICPPQDAPEEYIMEEDLFRIERAMGSFDYLRTDIYKLLEENATTDAFMHKPTFYITYPNQLRILEGTLLRQALTIAELNLELAKKEKKPSDIKQKQKGYDEAKRKFCEFFKTAIYVD